ncbi:MAG: hypothetical protein KF680_02205 [Cryobacterium sp.]|nr:hypothetical protein [Cryobacterium sp.]
MTPARSLRLLAAALALPLLLTGCLSPSVSSDESPVEDAVPTVTTPTDTMTEDESLADDASPIDLAEFPAHFPLPTQSPSFVDRVNYEWRIDYSFDSDAEPVERAEWFGRNGYQAIDIAEKVALTAGADARTWAWESDEFRVDLVLSPDGDGYVFRYTVLWK